MGWVLAIVIGGIFGFALGVWKSKKILEKQREDIPQDILDKMKQKEVKNGTEKESNKKSSKGSFGFFKRKSRDNSSEGGESIIDKSELNPGATSSITEQSDIPIQSSTKPKRTKSKLSKNKPNSKEHWPSFN